MGRTAEPTTRLVAVATGAQLGARGAHLVLNVASTLIVIRYLSTDAFGEYVIVLTTILLAGLVAEFGFPKLAVREMVRHPNDRDAILGTVMALRAALAVAAVGLSQLVLLAVDASRGAHLAGLIASTSILLDVVFTMIVITHVEMRQHIEALLRLLMEIVEVGVLVLLVGANAPLPALFVAPVAGAAVGAVGARLVARRRFSVRPRIVWAHARPLLREAVSIGPGVVIAVAYLKSDSLLLAARRSSTDVAIYGAAVQPIEYLFLSSAVVIGVVFPILAKAFSEHRTTDFCAAYRVGCELLIGAGLLVPIVVAIAGAPIVDLAYGGKYPEALTPLIILSAAFVLMVANAWRSFVLLAAGEQVTTLRYDLAALVVALVGGWLLVGPYGAEGAAIGVLVTATFVTVASTIAVRRLLHLRLDPRFALITLTTAGAAIAIGKGVAGTGTPRLLAATAAAAVYVVVVALFARPAISDLTAAPSAPTADLGVAS